MTSFLSLELVLAFSFYAVKGTLWGLSPIDLVRCLEKLGLWQYPTETATSK